MTDDAKFDALARKANESGGAMEDLNELFGAAFALEHWEFISRGELPNPYPYIASHPTVAGNQPMIRAFTGGDRLMRFARENHLVREDGSCDALKIPTANIVEYLEGFIAQGAYGIWFNSDAQSDGFFIPLKQLRPIKEHLTKKSVQSGDSASAAAAAPTQKPSVETLQFVVKEGLMLPSAEIIPAPYTSNNFWRVPSGWVENGKIKAEHLRKIEREMSGGRSENIDGAFYVVTDYSMKILTPEVVRATKWSEIVNEGDDLNMFYVASENGETENVSAQEFQTNVDAFFKSDDKAVRAPNERPPAFVTLIVQIKDGLGFPSGFVKEADYTCHLFCRVPEFWIDGDEQLKAEYLEKIYAQFYGVTWRMGNSDGSHFVVRDCYVKVLPPGMLKNIQWTGTVNDDKNQYWWYIASADGEVRSVKEEEFGADILAAEIQTPVKTEETPAPPSNLQNWGSAQASDGEIDLNLTVNKVGTVSFETSIAPFYEAVVPLLEDYKGVGEYVSLLRFESIGISQPVENIAENSHGAYLQIRRFVYLNPKNNVRIGVNSIHSKSLRHVRTNSELLVSFELCKNLDNRTAVFYHAFQGEKNEILKLSAAIEPILERFDYRDAGEQ